MTGFRIGDEIAAAVLSYKHAALRVGVIEKIHPPTGTIREERYTIRDEKGNPFVVSRARSVLIKNTAHVEATAKVKAAMDKYEGWYVDCPEDGWRFERDLRIAMAKVATFEEENGDGQRD